MKNNKLPEQLTRSNITSILEKTDILPGLSKLTLTFMQEQKVVIVKQEGRNTTNETMVEL